MSGKTVAKYPKFCATVEPILLAFSNLYIGEFWFSYVYYLLSKERNTLKIEMW